MNKKKLYILLIVFLIFITSNSLNSNYKTILELYKKDLNFNRNEINILIDNFNNDTSDKWFSGYLLYKFYKKQNKIDYIYYYSKLLYKYSYIEDEEVRNSYIQTSVIYKKYDDVLKIIEGEKEYKNVFYKSVLLENKKEFLKLISVDEFNELLFSMGFYDELLNDMKPDKNIYISSLYGLRMHNKLIDEFDFKQQYSDRTIYHAARSFAAKNKFYEATKILDKIDYTKKSIYSYYYNYYSLLSDKDKFNILNIKNIKNSYYRAKLTDYFFKYNNDKIDKNKLKDLYEGVMDDPYIPAKIYSKYNNDFDLTKPLKYEESLFNNLERNLYKSSRNINSNKSYFYTYDSLINNIIKINPYIVYNDIKLTKYNKPLKRVKDLYVSNLPYYGLKNSFGIKLGDMMFLRYPLAYYNKVYSISKKIGIDPFFVWSIMREESAFKWIVSERGASGFMQIMPSTKKWLCDKYKYKETGDKYYDNIYLGSLYLKYLVDRYSSQENPIIFAIMAYNGGPGNVDKWIKKHHSLKKMVQNIPYFETERYLFKVYNTYREYIKYYDIYE